MREKVKVIASHPLIAGSTIVFVGSFAANFFSYLFNLLMGRMLSVSEYGLLASLSSLLVILTIFSTAFTKIFAKFSARYIVKKDSGSLKYLIIRGFKYISFIAVSLLVVLVLLLGVIGDFLKVENSMLLLLVFATIMVSLVGSIPEGIVQGSMRFYTSSFLSIFQSILKLIIAVGLVYLGFQIFGAVIAILLAALLTVLLGYFIILKSSAIYKVKSAVIPFFRKDFTNYTVTFTLASLGITLLSNTDIILVRYFFEESVSGQYAALSLMGKAIFYLIMPINFVFFPLIAQKNEKKERLFNTVLLTFGIVFSMSIAISFVYFTFPGLVLSIFFPRPEYQAMKQYLGLFSLYIMLFSLVSIMNSFFLSIGKTKVYIFTLVAGIAQIGLIIVLHSSLYQIIGVLFIVNFLLLLSYFIYYMKHGKD